MTKLCTGCKEEKTIDNFYKRTASRDGYQPKCIDCEKKRNQTSEYKETMRVYNSGPGRDSVANYEKTEKGKATRKRYLSKPEVIDKNREFRQQYYLDNKESMREANREWLLDHPGYIREKTEERRARMRNIPNTMPPGWWKILLSFFGEECMNPECNKEINISNPLTHDHVIPITIEGSTHSLENSQILCKSCNSSKHNRIVDYRDSICGKM